MAGWPTPSRTGYSVLQDSGHASHEPMTPQRARLYNKNQKPRLGMIAVMVFTLDVTGTELVT